MTTLFIADCHLSPERPQIIELFCDFIETRCQSAQALYILGDLFDRWLGDDDPTPGLEAVFTTLRKYARTKPLYFMSGNHDFLVGRAFSERSGCRFVGGQPSEDAVVVDIEGNKTLLMHGDQLCSDDIAYQRYRRVVRNRMLQTLWKAMPLAWRQSFAERLISTSKHATAKKAETIMDVNDNTVKATMRRYQVQRLIHGHVHRPAIHDFTLDGNNAKRMVLGDWYEQGSVLEVSEEHATLDRL
ncbi:MAG: UDP-2,3-diacylglucosamine diphosphatase [Chromatiales bacterium]|nr:UDP-2,3-diacylglucosamine diphosphatase [Chromatiales bacterium]